MLGSGKSGAVRSGAAVGSAHSQDADIYGRYAVGLYRQALLTLVYSALGEQVVCDVTASESSPVPERAEDDTRRRLAKSIFWRCQQLAEGSAWQDRRSRQRPSGGVGGLGFLWASTVAGIRPRYRAALLRAVLRTPTISSTGALPPPGRGISMSLTAAADPSKGRR
jgi:hypothetical protein